MDSSILLIASYPKSGNTWTRIVLQGLLNSAVAGDLNAVEIGLYGNLKRVLFDEYAPAAASELSLQEMDSFTPWVNRMVAQELPSPVIIKTHEKARQNRQGEWLYPPECVRAVIYIVRHPFDVAASFANHMGYSPAKAVEAMRGQFWFAPQVTKAPLPLPEFVDDWSSNVASWTCQQSPYSTLVVRYEDMLQDDVSCFRRIAARAGVACTEEQLQHVVRVSRFDSLRTQEETSGFRERPETSSQFFRSGKPMSWKGSLTDALCAELCRDHGEIMSHFGYQPDGYTTFG